MIFVEGKEICINTPQLQANEILLKLLSHPALLTSSNSFRSLFESTATPFGFKTGNSDNDGKCIYIFQKEYAIVKPTFVKYVGTDELTTCVGIAIRNPLTGMVAVGHLDSVEIVERGLKQMLSKLLTDGQNLEVHLVGGFADNSKINIEDEDMMGCSEGRFLTEEKEKHAIFDGYSGPLCLKIVEELHKLQYNFDLKTTFILNHNTIIDPNGHALPIVKGFMVDTSTGSVLPASFDVSLKCPDEMVRRVRLSFSFDDNSWEGRLLETYDTENDHFVIAPCKWKRHWSLYANNCLQLEDSKILHDFSTSPYAEDSDFVDTQRRVYSYLVENPDWRSTFPKAQSRVFKRNRNGRWEMEMLK